MTDELKKQLQEVLGIENVEALETAKTIEELNPKRNKFLSESELNDLNENKFKSGKNEGFTHAKELTLKLLAKEIGIETVPKSEKEAAELIKKTFAGSAEEQRQQLENLIKQKEAEYTSELEKEKNNFKNYRENAVISAMIPTIQFAVPAEIQNAGEKEVSEFLKARREVYELAFKSFAKVDFDVNGNVIFRNPTDNEVIKDEYGKALNKEQILNSFVVAKKINIIQKTNPNNPNPPINPPIGQINLAGRTFSEVMEIAAKANVKIGTPEGDKWLIDNGFTKK